MRWLAGALPASLLVALLASGCGGGDDPASTPSVSTGSAGSTSAGPASSSAADPTASGLDSTAASDLASAAQSAASAVPEGPLVGGDISWPQCPPGLGIPHKISQGEPLPDDDAQFVVLGLTNGPGFHPNPCLADQVTYAHDRGLLVAAYSVISWPEGGVAQYGGARQAGAAEGRFNLATMKAAGLASPVIWLDVEPVPFYDWPADTAANAEVVRGAAQAYRAAGYRVGVYSTPYLWHSVVGDLTLGDLAPGGVPEWRAAGETSQAEAVARCGPDWSIQGGTAVLAQWVEARRDVDVTCPGQPASVADYFSP